MTTIQSHPISNAMLSKMNGASSSNASSKAGGLTDASGIPSTANMKSDFMTMLVAQMQYQDPTKPMDSAQMTSQLAQISTVDGINTLNSTMNSLVSSLQGNQTAQAANLIGHKVMVPGNSINLKNGLSQFSVELPSGADNVSVTISNTAGQKVGSMNLGAQAAGTVPVVWRGQDGSGNVMPDGNYVFQVNATSRGKSVAATGLQPATVMSVSNNGNGVMLNLDNKSSMSASGVQQIL